MTIALVVLGAIAALGILGWTWFYLSRDDEPVTPPPIQKISKNGKGKGKKVVYKNIPAPVEAVAPMAASQSQSNGFGITDFLLLNWMFNSGNRTETVVVHDQAPSTGSMDTPIDVPHEIPHHDYTPDPTPTPDFSSSVDTGSSFDSGFDSGGSFDAGGGND